jgi:L-lactate dehydrogenase complex protein LldE
MSAAETRPRVGLFVTCLVDIFRPSIGFAAARLIEASGCSVEVPPGQTCCGQPAYNAGSREDAKALALQTVRAFRGYDYIVAPSGSCAAMLKVHYPELLADRAGPRGSDPMRRPSVCSDPQSPTTVEAEAAAFAARVHELTSFLVNVRRMPLPKVRCAARATYHDSCSGLRELSVKREPRKLLGAVDGLSLSEMPGCETCCGFGGLFAAKYPEISNAMAEAKLASAEAAQAGLLLAGDLGCLMHLAGTARRQGRKIACRHVAEVLAGELADPPIAGPEGAT